MLKKIVIGIMLCSSSAYSSVTFNKAEEIYKKLIKKNNLILSPRLAIWINDDVNAFCNTENNTIAVSIGMLKFVKDENELAVVLGHELGHCMLRHRGSTPNHEYIADRVGFWLAQHAGYNICSGVTVLKKLNDPGGDTHPPSEDRYNRLKCNRRK